MTDLDASVLFRTPLYEEHILLNAKMGTFGGWNMPIFYSSILDEHKHCREKVSIFDTSHMGEFIFKGNIKESGIEEVFTQSLEKMLTGSSKYGFILNADGGIVDDIIVFKIAEDELMFVVNAATKENDFKMIKNKLKSGDLKDISSETAKLDIQGPLAREVTEDIFEIKLSLAYFKFSYFQNITISRTGYTGELGYEIFLSSDMAIKIWKKFVADKRVKPAGLGARDILRLEMGYSLYGNDLDEETTPIEAGLDIFVDFSKNFYGKKALQKPLKKVKIAFKTETRRAPRRGYKILLNKKEIGVVTSGCYSPSISAGIGIGYINYKFKEVKKIEITDGEKIVLNGLAVETSFYKNGSIRR